jgi:hypothetical protein
VFRFSSPALRHRVQNARSRTGCCATSPHTSAVLEKLAREKPEVLACMHGSAWRGDGAALLRSRPAGRVREGDHDDFGAAFAHNHCVGESPEQQAFRCALP